MLWIHRDHAESSGKGVGGGGGASREYGNILVLESERDLQNATVRCSICIHNIYIYIYIERERERESSFAA